MRDECGQRAKSSDAAPDQAIVSREDERKEPLEIQLRKLSHDERR